MKISKNPPPSKRKTLAASRDRYRDLRRAVLKLEVGQSVIYPISEWDDATRARNRVYVALRPQRQKVEKKGRKLRFAVAGDDSALIITLRKPAKKKKKRK